MLRHLFFVLLALSITACNNQEKPKKKQPPYVKTVVVSTQQKDGSKTYPGKVAAAEKVDLAFQVSGTLVDFPVNDGDEVKQGQLIAVLDARDFERQLDIADARLLEAENNFKRSEQLIKSGTISRAEFDTQISNYETAKAQQAIAQKAFDDTKLYAPFSGRIASTYVTNHQYVTAKQAIVSLQDISHVDIVIDLPGQEIVASVKALDEEQLKKLDAEHRLYISFDAIPVKTFPVVLKEFETEADPITQSYQITLTMPSPDDATILPGMATTLHSHTITPVEESLHVPASAVAVDNDGQHYVWVVGDDLVTEKRMVDVEKVSQHHVQVNSGLNNGDRIITAGVYKVQPDTQVILLESNKEF